MWSDMSFQSLELVPAWYETTLNTGLPCFMELGTTCSIDCVTGTRSYEIYLQVYSFDSTRCAEILSAMKKALLFGDLITPSCVAFTTGPTVRFWRVKGDISDSNLTWSSVFFGEYTKSLGSLGTNFKLWLLQNIWLKWSRNSSTVKDGLQIINIQSLCCCSVFKWLLIKFLSKVLSKLHF